MITINRQYRFTNSVPLVNSQLDAELDNMMGTFNNLNLGLIAFDQVYMKAPDGKIFKLQIIYDTNGITPILEIV